MVEGDVAPSTWPTDGLHGLEGAIRNAHDANKYLLIWDKQGGVGTFLKYKGHLAELGPEVIKQSLGMQSAKEVGEFIRKNFV